MSQLSAAAEKSRVTGILSRVELLEIFGNILYLTHIPKKEPDNICDAICKLCGLKDRISR